MIRRHLFAGLALALSCLSFAAHAQLTSPSAITYLASDGTRRIHVFADKPGLSMVENRFDGSTWSWVHHQVPEELYGSKMPVAITFVEDGTQRIYVFGQGGQLKFRTRYFNGTQWQWAELPGGSLDNTYPHTAVTLLDQNGKRHIFVIGVSDLGSFGHIMVTHWNGTSWQAKSLDAANARRVVSPPVAVAYTSNGQPRVQVFCNAYNEYGMASPTTLRSMLWDGVSWSSIDYGIKGFKAKSAVAFTDGDGTQVVRLYGNGPGGLYQYTWNGLYWVGSSLGTPSADLSGPGVVEAQTYVDFDGVRKHFVAANFGNRLYWKVHDGTGWSSFTAHATNFAAQDVSAIGYPGPFTGTRFIQMFTTSGDKLMRSRFTGTSWKLYDNGSP